MGGIMKVLILTSSTGKGHDMQAQAIKDWANIDPDLNYEIHICKPLEDSHLLYAFGVGIYNWIQKTKPLLHHLYYNFLEWASIVRCTRPLGSDRFRSVLEKIRPDIIISVHDSLNHGFLEFAREVLGKDCVLCITYCSELSGGYGFSRHWVNPSADLFIGAVKETCDEAVRLGMNANKTYVGGFLARPNFYCTSLYAQSREVYIREELKLDPNSFILLMLASGRGAQNHVRLLEEIRNNLENFQVVVLCGQSTRSWSEVFNWSRINTGLTIRLLPHDENVGRLMHSVSAVIARPGGGSISEAIVSRCPLILNCIGGLMPQEIINVKYCIQNDLGVKVRKPKDLVDLLISWKSNSKKISEISERMKNLNALNGPVNLLKKAKEYSITRTGK